MTELEEVEGTEEFELIEVVEDDDEELDSTEEVVDEDIDEPVVAEEDGAEEELEVEILVDEIELVFALSAAYPPIARIIMITTTMPTIADRLSARRSLDLLEFTKQARTTLLF